MSTNVQFEVRNVSLSFGGLVALNDVSFEVDVAGSLGVIGPNGAGKSSLLNCINGVYHPQAGSVLLEGQELVGRRPAEIARLGVSRTFQGVELFRRLTTFENVVVAAEQVPHRSARWAKESARESLETLGLTDLAKQTVSALSYGEQKAVALARAFSMRPKVLLLDEPTSGMGTGDRAAVGDIVRRMQASGVTIVLIEHDVGFIRQCCDLMVVLDFGEVIASGKPADVVQDERVQRAYLGAG
jgi:branched-chain amino acid transport system ATP-binding protein